MKTIGIKAKFHIRSTKLEILPNPKNPSSLETSEFAASPKLAIVLLVVSADHVMLSVPGISIIVARKTTKINSEISPVAVPGNALLMKTISF